MSNPTRKGDRMHTMRTSKIILLLLLLTSTSIEAKERQKVVHHKVSIHKSKVNPLVGTASYYGPGFHGKTTSSGESFTQNKLTAAHRTIAMNSMVKVTNLENNKSVIVRITDRGPWKKGRILDLSKSAAQVIKMDGLAKVSLQILKNNS